MSLGSLEKTRQGLVGHAFSWSISLPRVIEILLVLAIASVVLMDMFSALKSSPTVLSNRPVRDSSTENTVSLQSLIDAAPFGKAEKSKKQSQAPAISRREIKLKGTVVANHESAAMVQLSPRGKLEVFHIGDRILPGVILRQVKKDRVFIEANGKMEAVLIEDVAAKFKGASAVKRKQRLKGRKGSHVRKPGPGRGK